MEHFNNFADISYGPLRTFNRVVMCHNILEDSGEASFLKYIQQFSKEDRQSMVVMSERVKELGPDKVRREVTQGLVFTDE